MANQQSQSKIKISLVQRWRSRHERENKMRGQWAFRSLTPSGNDAFHKKI